MLYDKSSFDKQGCCFSKLKNAWAEISSSLLLTIFKFIIDVFFTKALAKRAPALSEIKFSERSRVIN